MKMVWTACLSLALLAATASADTVSLVGDKDGFGLGGGTPAVVTTGTWTGRGGSFPDDNRSGGDPLFTDYWHFEQTSGSPLESPIDYTHSYVLDGIAVSAVLSINEAGMSDARGPWTVVFNGVAIGNIGEFPSSEGQTFKLLSFAVPLGLLTGSDDVSLVYRDTAGEGFAINYSELFITTRPGGTGPVPEPSTLALLGLVAGGYLVRRRRRS